MFSVLLKGAFKVPVRGRGLQPFDVQRILDLLATTDMSMAQIAERMGCSSALIASINRRYEVRDYGGCRTRWMLNIKEGTWWSASI